MFGGKKVICALSLEKPENLVFIKKLIEDGKILQKVEKTVYFPLLIVVGDHELDLLQKTAAAWHESEPVSEFHTISNAGHCANLDNA
jgi:pimeloyl-ACP methyl ester carboxylesterase